MFNDQGIDIVLLNRIIDSQFINVIEQNKEGVKFIRVDSEVADDLKGDGEIKELPKVAELLKKVAGEKLTVKFDRFKDDTIPAILNVSEEGRRMNDMMAMYRMDGMPLDETLIMNLSSPLTDKLSDEIESGNGEAAETMARQIYRLAALSQRQLSSEELVDFLKDSYRILGMIN